MPRILYIHIGPMKTGTSALQSILSKHDNSSVIYPKVGLWGPGSHHGLVYSYFGKARRGKEPDDDCNKLFQKIRVEAQLSDMNLLISSEVLSERYKRRDPKNFIDALWDYLGRDGWNVEILLACREHLQRAASAYSQRVKGRDSSETRGPDEFLVEDAERYTYAPLIERSVATGFKVTVLNYHPAETWTARFSAYLGIPDGQVPAAPDKNVSLSIKALIAKLSANRVLRTDKERATFARMLKKMPGYHGSSRQMFGREAMIRAETHFSADRAFLLENFGIRLPEAEIGNPCKFVLDVQALAEIATITRPLGQVGEEIVRAASEFTEGSRQF